MYFKGDSRGTYEVGLHTLKLTGPSKKEFMRPWNNGDEYSSPNMFSLFSEVLFPHFSSHLHQGWNIYNRFIFFFLSMMMQIYSSSFRNIC